MASIAHLHPSRREGWSAADAPSASGRSRFVARFCLAILIWLAISLGAASAYLAWVPPLYRASSSVLIEPVGAVASSTQPVARPHDVQFESWVRLVSSPAVLARAAATQNLADDPEFSEPEQPFAVRLRDLFGWETPDEAALPVEQRVLGGLAERLDVGGDDATSIIDISVSSREPGKAVRLADAVADAFVSMHNASSPGTALSEAAQPDARRRELAERVRADELRLEAFRSRNQVLVAAPSSPDPRQLAELTSALAQARAAARDARLRLEQAERTAKSGRIESLPQDLGSGALAALRIEAADAQRRSDAMAKVLGPRHPDFVEAQRQLQSAHALIRDELRRAMGGLRKDVDQASATEGAAQRAVDAKRREVDDATGARAELLKLQQALQSARAAYERLGADESPPRGTVPGTKAKLLVAALPPLKPEGPDAQVILLGSAAAGLVLGLVTAFARRPTRPPPPPPRAAAQLPTELPRPPARADEAPSRPHQDAVSALEPDDPEPSTKAHLRRFHLPGPPAEIASDRGTRQGNQDPTAFPDHSAPEPLPATEEKAAPAEPLRPAGSAVVVAPQSPPAGPGPAEQGASKHNPILGRVDRSADVPWSGQDGYVRRFHFTPPVRPAE